ncbi:hypothetical protein [Salinivibrio sp. AR640]|uniref:hypothetical protein n=1 Tax=Salinivibrio sp. AR640 TaxID=1909437 RepID=UPI000986866C|nr:hypothetical protein [Salinivibrio sp. AR640]OOE86486.1 hypothetical protein BZG75_15110 [Salinivibrio sp. AR640]
MALNLSLVAVLGVEEYGAFSYLEYISLACFSLSNLGLTSIFTKESQNKRNSIQKIVTNFLGIKMSVLILLISLSHGYLLLTEEVSVVITNAVYTFLFSCLIDWVFVSYGQIKKLAKHYIVYFLFFFSFLSASYFISEGITLIDIRVMQIVALSLALPLCSTWIVKNIDVRCFDISFIKEVVPRGINMMISQLIQNGVLISLTTIIKANYGLLALGHFSFVMRFVNMVLSLRNMFMAPLTKYIINSGVDEYINVRERLKTIALIFMIFSFSVMFIIRVNEGGGFFYSLIEKYQGVVNIAIMVLPIPAMVLFTLVDGVIINMHNKQRVYLCSVVFSLVIFVITIFASSSLTMTILSFVLFEIMYLLINRVYINKVILVGK